MTGRLRAGMSLDILLLVWGLRVVLESDGISEDFSLNFLFVLPRLSAAAIVTLLLAFDCSFILSTKTKYSQREGKCAVEEGEQCSSA